MPFNTFPSLPKENKKNSATSKSPASGTPTLRPEDVTLPQKSVILKIPLVKLNLIINFKSIRFLVKSLGKAEAKGLWGIKHTRKPVDEMVTAAR